MQAETTALQIVQPITFVSKQETEKSKETPMGAGHILSPSSEIHSSELL